MTEIELKSNSCDVDMAVRCMNCDLFGQCRVQLGCGSHSNSAKTFATAANNVTVVNEPMNRLQASRDKRCGV